MHRGYVKDWRKSSESSLYWDVQVWHLFKHIVREAAWKPKGELGVGDYIVPVNSLAENYGVGRSTIHRWIEKMIAHQMLTKRTSGTGKLIVSVCNYNTYQSDDSEGGTGNRPTEKTGRKRDALKPDAKRTYESSKVGRWDRNGTGMGQEWDGQEVEKTPQVIPATQLNIDGTTIAFKNVRREEGKKEEYDDGVPATSVIDRIRDFAIAWNATKGCKPADEETIRRLAANGRASGFRDQGWLDAYPRALAKFPLRYFAEPVSVGQFLRGDFVWNVLAGMYQTPAGGPPKQADQPAGMIPTNDALLWQRCPEDKRKGNPGKSDLFIDAKWLEAHRAKA